MSFWSKFRRTVDSESLSMSASSRGYRRSGFATERTQLRCRKNIYFMRRAITYAILNVPSRDIVPSYEPRRNRYELDNRQSTTPRKSKTKSNVLHLSQKKNVSNEILRLSSTADVCLKLTGNGEVSLWNVANGTEKLVAQASLQLPQTHLDSNFTKATVVKVENAAGPGPSNGPGKTIVRWGSTEDSGSYAELHITPLRDGGSSLDDWMMGLSQGVLLDFRVLNTSASANAEIAVSLEPSGYWFGGGHFIRQVWPLNDAALEVGPWLAFDNGPNGVNTLLGPHWMTSGGLLVAVDPNTPFLHIGMNAPVVDKGDWTQRKWGVGIQNATRELLPLTQGHARVARAGCDGLLRIQARSTYKDLGMVHPLKDWHHPAMQCEEKSGDDMNDMLSVRVALCANDNAAEACKMALRTHKPPRKSPAPEVFCAPIWTTWARFKTKVTQSKVLKYANEISDRGLPRSVMEIDDRWQVAYGDLAFDPLKFPDPRSMVDSLHAAGFKVTVWVHPFVEEKSAAFREGASKGYFVGADVTNTSPWGWLLGQSATPPIIPVAPGGSSPGFFAWWNSPPVAALDVTNPEAVDWFVGRLRALQEATGIDGFKFDAGEPCFLPRNPKTHTPLATPADYTRLYVARVAGQFAGGVSEVRTGHMTQDVAVLCRMGDRFSTWDAANGLRSLIPTLLTSGLLGYPFCLPDMVGGNAYFGRSPDRELLVRWAQASCLMPSLQFSIAPWDVDRETERMVAGALKLRQRMEGLLLSLAEEAAHNLNPICRPLFMLSPHDEQTYQIHDQFALGDQVIVAPVVHKGAKRRDVYLTEGYWRDAMDPSNVFEGGQWLRGLSAPLDHLPVFVKEGAHGIFL